jgi:hypothetical protein
MKVSSRNDWTGGERYWPREEAIRAFEKDFYTVPFVSKDLCRFNPSIIPDVKFIQSQLYRL